MIPISTGKPIALFPDRTATIPVRLSDETMSKVLNLDEDPMRHIALKGRVDSAVDKELSVKELWDAINQSAYNCADPGAAISWQI
jgi:ribonucleoside-diphosphate reductase alpha chain